MTAANLIAGSLRLIGALASGEAATAAEAADALSSLNDMLEGWTSEGFLIYKKTVESFSLVGSQQTYTYGTGGDFNSARPVEIEAAGMLINNTEVPMNILTMQQWSEVSLKSISSTLPRALFVDNSFPLMNLTFWPLPVAVNTVNIYARKPLGTLLSSDTISMPQGYARALRYGLAVEIAPEYGKEIDPVIMQIAVEAKANIKRANIEIPIMTSDATGLIRPKPFNWRTGE